jgi:hypothetical protein
MSNYSEQYLRSFLVLITNNIAVIKFIEVDNDFDIEVDLT